MNVKYIIAVLVCLIAIMAAGCMGLGGSKATGTPSATVPPTEPVMHVTNIKSLSTAPTIDQAVLNVLQKDPYFIKNATRNGTIIMGKPKHVANDQNGGYIMNQSVTYGLKTGKGNMTDYYIIDTINQSAFAVVSHTSGGKVIVIK